MNDEGNPVVECSNKHHKHTFLLLRVEQIDVILQYFKLLVGHLHEAKADEEGPDVHRDPCLIVLQLLDLRIVEQEIVHHVSL